MDIATMITSMPSWLLFLLTIVAGVVAAEAGVWLRVKKISTEVKSHEGPVGSLIGAMLGLLAFMLGFTFSITSARFANRKEMVALQAKAIGTCYLRTDLIPLKQKNESRRLFAEYVHTLLEVKNPAELDKSLSKLESINLQIWEQAASLVSENMDSPLRALYISSVNEVLDTYGRRKSIALINRIPTAIWIALLVLFTLSMFIVGYEIGENKRRRFLNTPIMAAAFSVIVALIADMDSSTHSQNFKASLQPFEDVRRLILESK